MNLNSNRKTYSVDLGLDIVDMVIVIEKAFNLNCLTVHACQHSHSWGCRIAI